ncbi:HD domain containing protein [Verticillium alfalfae VaMs.102]|uniref:HD domain containing protein n=1 Tax=Verticillium alfalfae (strain VaMs.102 / ATCC MYA-4576 / FGSC 10136) TaxID=526221 RepID=C9S5Q3_VERA1|nr:HD domain containing protein [Verticillium alfalfae VaMs.102]EEY14279.1 HD domain containing protein [Verticillium alfalfae VaMs.102]
MDPLDLYADDNLVTAAAAYVKDYMSNYDASHDWSHILRVLALAHKIYNDPTTNTIAASKPALSLRKITLAALLHDVGDKKYLQPGQDHTRLVHDVLLERGAPEALAVEIQTICLGVSYSSEVKDPNAVVALLARVPELAVVQDADRLDAIGAVGVGRCFTFGGAKGGGRGLQGAIDHFEEKLLRIEGMMKTEAGRRLAAERTERLRVFEQWWRDETA